MANGADPATFIAAQVGTGFTGEVSAALRKRLDNLAQDERPFSSTTGHDRHATWVKPELACDVTYNEWPQGGSLRHASFKGLTDQAIPEKSATKAAAKLSRKTKSDARDPVKVTHGSRIIDPSSGFTKLELGAITPRSRLGCYRT